MTDGGESPLGRWSRRKAEARRGRAAPVAVADVEAAPDAAAPEADLAEVPADTVPAPLPEGEEVPAEAEAAPPPDLPPLDSLDRESDYTPFLADGVPEDLARAALRTLWRSDPVFANLDGLNDYDQDFNTLDTAISLLDTDYRVGRGFAGPDDGEEAPLAQINPETDPETNPDAGPDAGPEAGGDAAGTSEAADPGETAEEAEGVETAENGDAYPDGEAGSGDAADAGDSNDRA